MLNLPDAYADDRYISIAVRFAVVDENARGNITDFNYTDEDFLSKSLQVFDDVENVDTKIGELGLNHIILDGTFILPEQGGNYGQVGYRSNTISDTNRNLEILMEIKLSAKAYSPGFTLFFADKPNDIPCDFDVDAYYNQTRISHVEIRGNTSNHVQTKKASDGYNRVVVTFKRTLLPERRIKLVEFGFGQIEIFTGDELESFEGLYELSPTMDELPSNELTINFDNLDGDYNLLNPSSILKYLEEGTEAMTVTYGVGSRPNNIVTVKGGSFFYSSASTDGDGILATLVGNDPFYSLDQEDYLGGDGSIMSLSSAINDIMKTTAKSYRINISPSVGNRTIAMNIEPCTKRAALQIVCQAARCHCYFDRENVMQVRDMSLINPLHDFTPDNMAECPKVTTEDKITAVKAIVTSYKLLSDSTEVTTTEVELTAGKSTTLVISHDPALVVGVTVNTPESLITYTTRRFATEVRLTSGTSGTYKITLSGRKFEANETSYIYGSETSESKTVEINNKALTKGTVNSFLQWYFKFATLRAKYDVADRGNPALEIGDTVRIFDKWNENRNAFIALQKIEAKDGLTSDIEAYGGGIYVD